MYAFAKVHLQVFGGINASPAGVLTSKHMIEKGSSKQDGGVVVCERTDRQGGTASGRVDFT